MPKEEIKKRILDLPHDAKKISTGQTTRVDVWDQLSAIERIIEEGFYPNEKKRILADIDFKIKFDNEIVRELQLEFYENIERIEPEMAAVRNFLQENKKNLKLLIEVNCTPMEKKSQEDSAPAESELQKISDQIHKEVTEILVLEEWERRLSTLRNQEGIKRSCRILEHTATILRSSNLNPDKIKAAVVSLNLFNQNFSQFTVTVELIDTLIKAFNTVAESIGQAKKKLTGYNAFTFGESIVEPCKQLEIFAQLVHKMNFIRCAAYVLDEIKDHLKKFTLSGCQEARRKLKELREFSASLNSDEHQQLKTLLHQAKSRINKNAFFISRHLAQQCITEMGTLIDQLHNQNLLEFAQEEKRSRKNSK